MDPRTRKLGMILGDPEQAAALVSVGLDSPRKIKHATNEEIERAPGIGASARAALRARFPRPAPGPV